MHVNCADQNRKTSSILANKLRTNPVSAEYLFRECTYSPLRMDS